MTTTTRDLASRLLGGTVVAASDEAFGDKENLLNPGPVNFVPGSYSARGEIVDGWETRRRRRAGDDWAVVRLGAPGVIRCIDVDTTSFTGNQPVDCRIEACGIEGYPGPEELEDADWQEIVAVSPLSPDQSNHFTVDNPTRFTHVRLTIRPDGGVGRLRIHGETVPDPRDFDYGAQDLASQMCGGLVVDSSDEFYSTAESLNRPDLARSMGEGWETRRSRDQSPDWVVIRLASRAHIHGVVVDTAHFRYNASASVSVHGADWTGGDASAWSPLLPITKLQPDTRHTFWLNQTGAEAIQSSVTHIRLDAFPDGGLSRLRVIGTPDARGRLSLGLSWWNSLPQSQLGQVLTGMGVAESVAHELAERRSLLGDDVNAVSAELDSYPVAARRLLLGIPG
ncbi:allantoicase [Mycolicibacterium sp. 050232]|uniref:allantoicase n=1 Tax=Mycolicibacterium sp. 050232 TaxID=3113982 RepID=UPI002E2A3E8A|nr:allantoicase [Mycolicibacterium sp. 050232]MED5814379.1 allantoicase [Mycolicibacterium sp. 050232]